MWPIDIIDVDLNRITIAPFQYLTKALLASLCDVKYHIIESRDVTNKLKKEQKIKSHQYDTSTRAHTQTNTHKQTNMHATKHAQINKHPRTHVEPNQRILVHS